MESSDWSENQKKIIKIYDPERYEKIWGSPPGKVKALITEVEPEVKEPEPEPEPETKKEEESAAE